MPRKKKNLQVSFSGGETSAYMAQWLWNNKSDEYDMVFVFANTGEENEETLEFVQKCSDYFGFPVNWLEAEVSKEKGQGTRHKVVDFESASRKGQPFEDVISKYGIPNQVRLHCTRELKLSPMTSFTRDYFNGEKYYSAIGIRSDEADRMHSDYKKLMLWYPLITDMPMTKPKINFWWSQQPFRLNLKGYQGNCKTCWKKADKKLFQIYKDNPEYFDFNIRMEEKYGRVGAEFEATPNARDRVFFRRNRSTWELIEEAKNWSGVVHDDASDYNYQIDLLGGESCEVWAECGSVK